MTETRTHKLQFNKNREYNGIVYKSARLTMSPLLLDLLGINEDNPNVKVEYDYGEKKITITGCPQNTTY